MIDFFTGDCRAVMRSLPEKSVHAVVTSPPYYGLRNYGIEPVTWADGTVCCLGNEPTVNHFVAHLVEVFAEVRRVLRDDGTLWLNLGDSYTNGSRTERAPDPKWSVREEMRRARAPRGLKEKDLMGVPWRVALALQADGWYLRADCIWSKGSCMPESVKDRPSRSHEYIFMLTKSPRYYWDKQAVLEDCSLNTHRRRTDGKNTLKQKALYERGHTKLGLNTDSSQGRNVRTVWQMNPRPFPGAHFAVFPPAIPERCIRASTSEYGCCAACGAPYRRVVMKGAPLAEHQAACGGDKNGEYHGVAQKDYETAGAQNASATKARILAGMRESRTIGWDPTCACQRYAGLIGALLAIFEENPDPVLSPVPAVVLDPFSGAGTTQLVARQLGRRSIYIDQSAEYCALARERLGCQEGAVVE